MKGEPRTPHDVRAALYREAARRIAEKERTTKYKECCEGCLNSCCMVSEVSDRIMLDKYENTMAPDNAELYWGKGWGNDAHKCRILALCFMAAMVEAGDA